uniref:Uncharacterized protein MANES_07G091500 n=1 Tax=Rhizophora mucronata TaxID=61149 RepID=A0A2P2KDA2_RHIMU
MGTRLCSSLLGGFLLLLAAPLLLSLLVLQLPLARILAARLSGGGIHCQVGDGFDGFVNAGGRVHLLCLGPFLSFSAV